MFAAVIARRRGIVVVPGGSEFAAVRVCSALRIHDRKYHETVRKPLWTTRRRRRK
jgi:hypothetical protein